MALLHPKAETALLERGDLLDQGQSLTVAVPLPDSADGAGLRGSSAVLSRNRIPSLCPCVQ